MISQLCHSPAGGNWPSCAHSCQCVAQSRAAGDRKAADQRPAFRSGGRPIRYSAVRCGLGIGRVRFRKQCRIGERARRASDRSLHRWNRARPVHRYCRQLAPAPSQWSYCARRADGSRHWQRRTCGRDPACLAVAKPPQHFHFEMLIAFAERGAPRGGKLGVLAAGLVGPAGAQPRHCRAAVTLTSRRLLQAVGPPVLVDLDLRTLPRCAGVILVCFFIACLAGAAAVSARRSGAFSPCSSNDVRCCGSRFANWRGRSESVYRDVPYLCHISVTMSIKKNPFGYFASACLPPCAGLTNQARQLGTAKEYRMLRRLYEWTMAKAVRPARRILAGSDFLCRSRAFSRSRRTRCWG